MLKNCRIGNICFFVKDVARTEAFYRDVMGLEIQHMGDDGSGNDWIMISIENNIDLIFFKGDSRPGTTPILVFDLNEGLAGKGASIVTPVSYAPGGWSAEFSDPDGHQFSLYQSEDMPRRRS